jgi:thiosulfate dehydrogenase [quinone] large subunit
MVFAPAGTAKGWATVYLRFALAAGFLTAVTDRFGFWGPPGVPNVAWGDFQRFTQYAGVLNPWAPAGLIPPLAWFVTVVESVLACALIAGIGTRYAALASGVLLALFALGMTMGTGFKSALNYSVFAASAGAFALATAESYRWSLDALLESRARRRGAALATATRPAHGAAGTHPSYVTGNEPVRAAGRDQVR